MFLRRSRGMLDFIVAALCFWAAFYHTPLGALARAAGGWALGFKSSGRPLLAYYRGRVYDAQPKGTMGEPIPPGLLTRGELLPSEALAHGAYVVLSELESDKRQPALALAERFQVPLHRAHEVREGPVQVARLVSKAAFALGSEEGAVLALFCGYEPALYAKERTLAEGRALSFEEMVGHLPPGYGDQIAAASKSLTLGTAYTLAWPLPLNTPVTSPFGVRVHPVFGLPKMHNGVDLSTPVGTPVRAAGKGIVRRASSDAINGRVLILDHGRGVTTAYCHNSQLLVEEGAVVEKGQTISRSGNSGQSTGPHLHYQVELADQPVDPFLFYRKPAVWPQPAARGL